MALSCVPGDKVTDKPSLAACPTMIDVIVSDCVGTRKPLVFDNGQGRELGGWTRHINGRPKRGVVSAGFGLWRAGLISNAGVTTSTLPTTSRHATYSAASHSHLLHHKIHRIYIKYNPMPESTSILPADAVAAAINDGKKHLLLAA